MNTLFVYGYLILERKGDTYYHNFLDDILNRYSCFGNLTICSPLVEVENPSSTVIDMSPYEYHPAVKENTIYHRFINRRTNKETLRLLVQRCDFLIVHTPSSLSNLASYYARRFNKPYMTVSVGCVWDALVNHSFRGKLLAPIEYYGMRKAVKKSNYSVYVTSEFLQSRYPTEGQMLGCSDVAIKEIDIQIYNTRKDKLSEYDNRSSEVKIVTTAAVDNPYKGQEYVIKAVKFLVSQGYNFHYYLIGPGRQDRLAKLVHDLKIDDHIHFLGGMPHQEIFNVLQTMDIYIQPSRLEALPRALIEAMSMGLPCFATNVGGIPELLEHDCLFAKGDIKKISQLLLSSKEKLMICSEKNYEKAKNYLPSVLKQKRDSFFNQIIRELQNA